MKRARKRNSKRNTTEEILYTRGEEQEGFEPEPFEVREEEFPKETEEEVPFAVSDGDFEAEVPEEPSAVQNEENAGEAEEDVPFAQGAFVPELSAEIQSTENNSGHSEDYLKRKAMNRKKFEKKRKRKRIITVCTGIFLLLIIVFAGVLGMDFSGGDGEGFTTPVDVQTGKINVLLLGVDKDGERSDSIMLVSYDFDDHSIKLLSVPRDTKMYVTDRAVTRKITEVHGMHNSAGKMYGASAVAEAVTALTGVPINYYLEFSFDALDNVMDILGPVTFDVPDIEGGGRGMNYDDGYQDLHIHLKPGVQELAGNQIQQFLRYRKSNSGTTDGSDISRVGRQQELLKAIIDQKINLELIIKIPDIFKEIKSQLKTNFGVKDVIKYAGYLKDISSENMSTYVLPGESAKTSGAWYYVCDMNATADLISTTFEYPVTAEQLTNEINLTGKKTAGKTQQSEKKDSSSNKSTKVSNETETKTKSGSSETKTSSAEPETKKSESKKSNESTEQKSNSSQKNTSVKQEEKTAGKSESSSEVKKNEESAEPSDSTSKETASGKEEKSGAETEEKNTSSAQDEEPISLD